MPGQQRADARRNRERILEVARAVIGEQGTQASLRDIARRAGVGLGTLYRHFPNREALLDVLMRRRFDHLSARAAEMAGRLDTIAAGVVTRDRRADGAAAGGWLRGGGGAGRAPGRAGAGPRAALEAWLTEFAYGSAAYRGMSGSIMATVAARRSPLHAACVRMRDAAGRLLAAAQATGEVRADLSVTELFALINAIGWIAEHEPEGLPRERLLTLVMEGLAREDVEGPARKNVEGPERRNMAGPARANMAGSARGDRPVPAHPQSATPVSTSSRGSV